METCLRHNFDTYSMCYTIFIWIGICIGRVGASQVVFIKFIITLHYSLI